MRGKNFLNWIAEWEIGFQSSIQHLQRFSLTLQAGYSPDEDTLIAMRIRGTTPEFIEKVQGLAYSRLEPDELIATRIH